MDGQAPPPASLPPHRAPVGRQNSTEAFHPTRHAGRAMTEGGWASSPPAFLSTHPSGAAPHLDKLGGWSVVGDPRQPRTPPPARTRTPASGYESMAPRRTASFPQDPAERSRRPTCMRWVRGRRSAIRDKQEPHLQRGRKPPAEGHEPMAPRRGGEGTSD